MCLGAHKGKVRIPAHVFELKLKLAANIGDAVMLLIGGQELLQKGLKQPGRLDVRGFRFA